MRATFAAVYRRIRLPMILIGAALLLYLAWIGADETLAGYELDKQPRLESSALGERLLVISPHPDDETLAAGGLVHEAVSSGRRVLVVIVTSGDGFRRILPSYVDGRGGDATAGFLKMGVTRAQEGRDALRVLGVPASDVVFLGYPDGSMGRLWNGDWAPARGWQGTNGQDAVPYAFAYRPGAAYSGSSVASDLASIVTSFAPTTVLAPDPDDSNGDHWAVNAFTQFALDRAGYRGTRLTYLVHRGHFPFPWSYLPSGLLQPPVPLRLRGDTWLSYRLERGTAGVKEDAVGCFVSQRKAMEPFVDAFVRRNEIFAVCGPPAVTPSLSPGAISSETTMPGVVLRDPPSDTPLRVLESSGDIREVALVREGDRLRIGIGLQETPSRSPSYLLSLRLPDVAGPAARIDIEVHGGRASWLHLGEGAVSAAEPPALESRRNRIWVSFPASLLSGRRECLLSAETRIGDKVLDRTAVRRTTLP